MSSNLFLLVKGDCVWLQGSISLSNSNSSIQTSGRRALPRLPEIAVLREFCAANTPAGVRSRGLCCGNHTLLLRTSAFNPPADRSFFPTPTSHPVCESSIFTPLHRYQPFDKCTQTGPLPTQLDNEIRLPVSKAATLHHIFGHIEQSSDDLSVLYADRTSQHTLRYHLFNNCRLSTTECASTLHAY